MINQEKQAPIPYLSVLKMGKVMELVSERSLQNVSPSYFKSYGFGEADSYLAMNVLRFLKLVDENDKPTDRARKFQLKGDAKNKEVEATLKESYKELFSVTEKPYELPKNDLINEFMHNYSLTKRIAQSAAPAFLKLCEFAGLVEEGSVRTRRVEKQIAEGNRKQPKKERQTDRQKSYINESENTPIPFAGSKIKLSIPTKILTKAILDTQLGTDLKKVTDSISEFASKYYKDSETSKTESIEEQH